MYWADWGNHPKIETAAMDGTMRETLVHENIQWPTGQLSCTALMKITNNCFNTLKTKTIVKTNH